MDATPTDDPDVVDHADQGRYEIRVSDQVVGAAYYQHRPGALVFTHTEIEPAHEGQGLASRLIGAALDDARRRRLRVVPRCPYVAAYLRQHPEYQDLVDRD